jgi:hypothetical protein
MDKFSWMRIYGETDAKKIPSKEYFFMWNILTSLDLKYNI